MTFQFLHLSQGLERHGGRRGRAEESRGGARRGGGGQGGVGRDPGRGGPAGRLEAVAAAAAGNRGDTEVGDEKGQV